MKGDIRISKKTGLVLFAAASVIAMADYVSVLGSNSEYVTIKSAITDQDKQDILLESQPVGSVVFRMDSLNPADIYGGSWSLITGDASVSFGDGTVQSGSVIGDNQETITLPAHSHDRGTMEITAEYGSHLSGMYYGPYSEYDWVGAFEPMRATGNIMSSTAQRTGNGVNQGSGIKFTASKTWSGRTSIEGSNSPQMNIRDARIELNVWKRTH